MNALFCYLETEWKQSLLKEEGSFFLLIHALSLSQLWHNHYINI